MVATIALDVGYDSEAAFARAVERAGGMPPGPWPRPQARQLAGSGRGA